MKTIHLLRHAKSDWSNAALADINRPLNARGNHTAKMMAPALIKAGCNFNHIFCSPAVRAQSTITLISEQLPEAFIQWKTDDALYTFNSDDLLSWFQTLDESISELLMIGHNPALTDFCNHLSGADIANIPTCGYVKLVSAEPCSWSQMNKTDFKIMSFIKPKELMLP